MAAIALKDGMSSERFRSAAKATDDANQARRLLALAAIRDGMNRTEVGYDWAGLARIGLLPHLRAPRHPEQKEDAIASFKKRSPHS